MPGKIDLFKAALGNEAYLAEINSNSGSQLKFINTLEENQFTPLELIELINIMQEPRVRTLLIVRLLGQSDYLANLKGESVLNRIAFKESHTEPSRLNAWVHQLDVAILTPELINKLDPEAAVTLLCSVPHFHQLSTVQVQALLYKHLHRELFFYWVRHYAALPNAHYVLAHLMKLIYSEIINAIKDLELSKQELLTSTIIEHLQLFHPLPKKLFLLLNQESHLILAMRLYLNGHYYEAYTSFIKQLTSSLLHANHVFSSEAIELLLALENVSELKDTQVSTRALTSNYFCAYLKTNALAGSTYPLYHNGRLNTQKIAQDVVLNNDANPYPLSETETTLHDFLAQYQSINFFEYFTIHYQGDIKPFARAVNEYLYHFIITGDGVKSGQIIQRLLFLLHNPQLDPSLKNSIFSAVLQQPIPYNERIMQKLFQYNAIATIRHFGFKGGKSNYQIVANLCLWALNEATIADEQACKAVRQALAEAEFELKLCDEEGLFSGLVKYLKRCWFYGWSGFFIPKNPVYVSPGAIMSDAASREYHAVPEEPVLPMEKDIQALLKEMEPPGVLTQDLFEALARALKHYAFSGSPQDEFETRMRVQALFNYVVHHNENQLRLYAWLKCNQGPFMENHFRLLALSLQLRPLSETEILIKQINDGPAKLMRAAAEFNSPLPQLNDELLPLTNAAADVSHVVTATKETLLAYSEQVYKTAQSGWGWMVKNFNDGFFAKPEARHEGNQVASPQSTSTVQL
ncbi:hypothetical protein [Legionella saoudiensis]|uniref:hypothetical protein n=1 Tax=Legionella saoudiensis TaxID=1750561 RepID=UPI0007317033|nr:hypothetical protein [Legionella saoudiensis]